MNTAVNAQARNRLLLAAAGAAAVVILVLQFGVLGARSQIFGDFHAFYCGGAAVLHGVDPYANASIAACEQRAQPFGLHNTAPGVTTPVPFPGYAFAFFTPFAALPYLPAAAMWLALLIACTTAAAVLIARLAQLPLWCSAAIVVPAYAIAVIGLGEVAPIALLALCAAALALRRQRYWFAAAMLCVAAVLPHVVLPAFIAAFVFARRMRGPLIVCGLALVALDVLMTGVSGSIEYFTRVLPAHAQSEIGYIAQYGLTWILHGAGMSDRTAVLVGDLSYAAACIAGVVWSAQLARRWNDGAPIVLLPPALAVIGGPFMHYSEITLALPALIILHARVRGVARALAGLAIVLLAVPWQWIVGETQLALPVALLAVFAIMYGLRGTLDGAIRATFGAVLYAAALLMAALAFGPQVQHLHGARIAGDLAQASWTAYIRSQGASAGTVWWLAKLPTWLGLCLLAGSGAYAAAHKQLVSAAVVDSTPAAT
jgi:hypothetical protein